MPQFSHSVVSNSLWPHGLQHTQLPCPSPTPRACSNSISIESVIPSNHLILCHPLLLLPSIIPSIRVFSYTIVNWGEKRGDRAESQGNETGANRNDLRPTKIKQRPATLCSYCGNCRMCLKYTLETVGSGPQVAMKAAWHSLCVLMGLWQHPTGRWKTSFCIKIEN